MGHNFLPPCPTVCGGVHASFTVLCFVLFWFFLCVCARIDAHEHMRCVRNVRHYPFSARAAPDAVAKTVVNERADGKGAHNAAMSYSHSPTLTYERSSLVRANEWTSVSVRTRGVTRTHMGIFFFFSLSLSVFLGRAEERRGGGPSSQADTLTIPLVRAALAAFFSPLFTPTLTRSCLRRWAQRFATYRLLISCSFSHTSAWTSGVLTSNISRNLQELNFETTRRSS